MIDESKFITGWCPPKDECSEYWCLDDGCPPGCTKEDHCPIEDPEGFPYGPPGISQCEVSQNLGFNQFYSFDQVLDAGDGIYFIKRGHSASAGFGHIRKTDYDLNTLWIASMESLTGYGPSSQYFATWVEILPDGRLATAGVGNDGTQLISYSFNIYIINTDGTLSENHHIVGTYYWDHYCTDIKYLAPGQILCAHGAQKIIGQSVRYHILTAYNIDTGEQTGFWTDGIARSTNQSACSPSLLLDGDDIFMGVPVDEPSNGVDVMNGVVKHWNLAGDYFGIVASGDADRTALRDYHGLGGKIMIVEDYYLVFSDDLRTLGLSQPIPQKGFWCIDVYNRSDWSHVKRLEDPIYRNPPVNGIQQYGTGFGRGFSRYGNFIIISSPWAKDDWDAAYPSYGNLYLYDLNFNYISQLSGYPPPADNSQSGYSLLMTADKIYQIYGTREVKICSYENLNFNP